MASSPDVGKLVDLIERIAEKAVARKAPRTLLGTVKSVSGSNASVLIDGDASQTQASLFCQGAASGKRALVLRNGTQLYVIGVRQ